MAISIGKLAFIFHNHHALKSALDVLSSFGFRSEELSVLIKVQNEQTSAKARTYSPALDPPTGTRWQELGEPGLSSRTEDSSPQVLDRQLAAEQRARIADTGQGSPLGLTAGTVALNLPGLGQILAAGPILSELEALPASADITALLHREGLSSEQIPAYREAFEAGQGLMLVKPINASEIKVIHSLLERYHPESAELL